MAKNLANQFSEFTSLKRSNSNDVTLHYCDECGEELIGNESCIFCETKEKKQETKRKRNFRD